MLKGRKSRGGGDIKPNKVHAEISAYLRMVSGGRVIFRKGWTGLIKFSDQNIITIVNNVSSYCFYGTCYDDILIYGL
jgi:hypothetical protein